MKRYARLAAVLLAIPLLFLFVRPCTAEEPQRPDVYSVPSSADGAKIAEVAALSPEEAFEALKGVDFLIDEKLLHKAIYETYKDRKADGMRVIFQHLILPQREVIHGKPVDRTGDFYVAKKFLEVFPDEVAPELVKLYNKGDGVVQGNVVRAAGKISSEKIKQLLVKALDNKLYCEAESPEMEGVPLRVCDEAYNQLVLRYKIRGVLRTIGNVFSLEVRDYHIGLLKKRPDLLN